MKNFLFIPFLAMTVALYGQNNGDTQSKGRDRDKRDGAEKPVENNAPPSPDKLRLDYVERFKTIAMGEMERTGIPASIKLSQAILESGGGTSELAVQANNHFGIKCGGDWQGKTYSVVDDEKGEDGKPAKSCFRKYATADQSFYEHSEFLRDPRKYNRYGYLFNLGRQDYRAWATGLEAAGYATGSGYASKLINVIEKYELYQYDRQQDVVPPMSEQGESRRRLGRVNDVKVVLSRDGETLDDIARIYRIRTQKVVDYNDFGYAPGVRLAENTRVYIQAKQRSWRGRSTHHIVREGQTMFEIAQQYAVQLDDLLDINNMKRGQEPAMNENIRLRGRQKPTERIRLRSVEDTPVSNRPGGARPGSTTTRPNSTNTPGSRPATTASTSGNRDDDEGRQMTTDNTELFELGQQDGSAVSPAYPSPATTNGNNNRPGTSTTDNRPSNNNGNRPTDWPGNTPTTNNPPPVATNPPPVNRPSTSGVPFPTTDPEPIQTIQTPEPPPMIPDAAAPLYHTVIKGDTVYSLTRRYNISADKLRELNGLKDNTLKLGQNLRVR
jgi:flagellum-specific peptidoglycan hydrolase FlgJ/LysM repeat protein